MIHADELLQRAFSEYTSALFAPEDAVLAELAARTRTSDVAPMQISAEVGRLLQVLALAVGARRILEVGTLFGYSTIWLARGLAAGGRLITLELDEERAREARRWIERAGLARAGGGSADPAVVEVRVGPALETLATLPRDEPFDLAFLDAAKEEYPAYLDHALELVRPGGIIAADNVLLSSSIDETVVDASAPSPRIQAVRAFNERIAEDPRLVSVVIPMREGVSVSWVRT